MKNSPKRLTPTETLVAIDCAMRMHLTVRNIRNEEAPRTIAKCKRDARAYMPANPTRQEVKDGVEWYFDSLGSPNLPLPHEITKYHQSLYV